MDTSAGVYDQSQRRGTRGAEVVRLRQPAYPPISKRVVPPECPPGARSPKEHEEESRTAKAAKKRIDSSVRDC